jgi:hypothetical protein
MMAAPMSARATFACLSFAVALVCAQPAATPAQAPAGTRIVAVGDVHGAGPGLAQILHAAGLIDAKQKWIGGTARLVQTGDVLDRGADVRAALDLLMRLEGEARRAGGRVDALFGNHEGMNVLHDFRDVSAEAMGRFADARSDDRLRKAFEAHAAIAKRAGTTLNRDEWMKAHPRGYPEYVDAFGPSGAYGRWMRGRKAVLQIGDTIFMHAGLHPDRTITIDEINRTVEADVRGWDDLVASLERVKRVTVNFTLQEAVDAAQVEIGKIAVAQKTGEPIEEYVTPEFIGRLQFLMNFEKLSLVESDGPLWYRGLATLPEDQQPAVDALLRRHGARRIVLGHTPQLPAGKIRMRFGGLVALIDTGMLASYFKGGQPSALEIQDGRLTAIYLSGREPVAGGTASRVAIGELGRAISPPPSTIPKPVWTAAKAHWSASSAIRLSVGR